MWKIFILIFDEIQNTIVIWYLIHDNNDFDQPPLCESYTVFVLYGYNCVCKINMWTSL